MTQPTYDPTPYPSDSDHANGLIPHERLRATDRPIVPGNERPKAGKPSYEELEAVLCGLEGERNLTKRRVVSEEMIREFAAMGGKVIKERGEIIVLCDFAEVTRHFGSS